MEDMWLHRLSYSGGFSGFSGFNSNSFGASQPMAPPVMPENAAGMFPASAGVMPPTGSDAGMRPGTGAGRPQLKSVSRIRQKFPEAWIWTEVETGYFYLHPLHY